MSDENACETPLVDLLRGIPKDYRGEWPIQWSEGGAETGHAMSPIGLHAHRAADTISQLEKDKADYLAINDSLVGSLKKLLENKADRIQAKELLTHLTPPKEGDTP